VKITLLCGEQPQSLSLWLSELLEFSCCCCCCNSLTNVLYSQSGGMLTLSRLYHLKPGVKFHPDLWDFSEKDTERSWRRIFGPVRRCPYVNYKFSMSQNICTVFECPKVGGLKKNSGHFVRCADADQRSKYQRKFCTLYWKMF
jgi:hypothetical protein